MLIQFSVGNYRSFKDIVTVSLLASSDKELPENTFSIDSKTKLLKSSVLFGANASGKSNIFKALLFMQGFIANSSKDTQINEKIPVDSFKLSTETEHKPSYFEVHFIHDKTLYRYGFEADMDKIHSEWLFYKPLGQPRRRMINLFTRESKKDGNKFNFNIKFKEGIGLETKTRPNALFLSVAAQFNGEISQKVLQWFTTRFNIISGYDEQAYMNFSISKLRDDSLRKEILKFTQAADLSIEDLIHESIDISKVQLPNFFNDEMKEQILASNPIKINTLHKKYDQKDKLLGNVVFDLGINESEGTKKIVFLSAPILDTLANGKMLFIDELDSRLHPLITEYIIKLFNSKETNPYNAQLFFAAHSSMLLGSMHFRRDQIWFTEKDKYGATSVYSLDDYNLKVRKDASFEKNYLQGKYGAIPYIDYVGAFNKVERNEKT